MLKKLQGNRIKNAVYRKKKKYKNKNKEIE